MTWLSVGPLSFDADLVVFDKDGTLIDFEYTWGRLVATSVEGLLAAVQGDDTMRRDLYRTLGYDPQAGRTAGDGPLATAPIAKLCTIAATVLYQHGLAWDDAEAHIQASFAAGLTAPPLSDLIRPVADVHGLLSHLQLAGVRVAVVTTDDRAATEETLALLGIADLVDFLICGDDGIPVKPAPDAVLKGCDHLGAQPGRTLVVGDTITDMVMARRAGAGCRAGVLTGVGSRASLAGHCDVILDSIADILVRNTASPINPY